MDYLKVSSEELRGVEPAELKVAERSVRKQLVESRMDIYSPQEITSDKSRRLRRTLARILTVRNEQLRAQKAK